MNILFIADIVGRPGRRVVSQMLPRLKGEYDVGFCVANGENAAGGFGLTDKVVRRLFSYGIDVITSGNHVWDKKEILPYLDKDLRLLRPANYPPGANGIGSAVFEPKEGTGVGVLNLQGRVFIRELDCPFRVALQEVEKLRGETSIIIVDFHAEATSEKIAMGWYLDGKVSAVIGTHTHVQTADEGILPQGTAYITDVGMTGPHDSVIGIDKEIALRRFLTQTPARFDPAKGDLKFCGAVISIDPDTGKAEDIKRLRIDFPG